MAAVLDLARQGGVGADRDPTESTNGRGLREVGWACRSARAGRRAGARRARGARVRCCSWTPTRRPSRCCEQPDALIAFARFRSDSLKAHANVVFPAEIYAEKEGTVTHPDGRVQRLRQALGHAGQVRPGGHVLGELCERLGAGSAALSLPEVTAEVTAAVPFYGGLTLDEIGGRWSALAGARGVRLIAGRGPSHEPLGAAAGARGADARAARRPSGPAPRWSTRARSASWRPHRSAWLAVRTRAGTPSKRVTRSSLRGRRRAQATAACGPGCPRAACS